MMTCRTPDSSLPWPRRRTAAAPGCSSCRLSLVLGIFYFIILLPMKRKQQKVQEFLDSLKVGDRVDHHRRHLTDR